MNHINQFPVAPVQAIVNINWSLASDMKSWAGFTGEIGFISHNWSAVDVQLPGVPTASVQMGARTPLQGLDLLPTLETQLAAIIAAIYDSNEVRMQLGADEAVYPPPADPVIPAEPAE